MALTFLRIDRAKCVVSYFALVRLRLLLSIVESLFVGTVRYAKMENRRQHLLSAIFVTRESFD